MKLINISNGKAAEKCLLMADISHVYLFLRFQRHGDDIVPVEIAVEHTRADSVAVKTDEQIEKSGTVADMDNFLVWSCA